MNVIQRYESSFSRSVEEVTTDLESYAGLLRKWQSVQNLVSRETLDDVWVRHFADSLQVLKFIGGADRNFLDFGSGGGLPAVPLAIAFKGSDRNFTLIEPNSRKVSFLRTVARELALPITVIGNRSDEIDSRETPQADVVTSRALASLPLLNAWIAPFFRPSTRALLHKGREHVEEIAESDATWLHDVLIHPSDTDAEGVILEITNLKARSKL